MGLMMTSRSYMVAASKRLAEDRLTVVLAKGLSGGIVPVARTTWRLFVWSTILRVAGWEATWPKTWCGRAT